MKLCFKCNYKFSADNFYCPLCGSQPEFIDGFPSFAPDLNNKYSCFPDNTHEKLFFIEQTYFWFLSRNELVKYLFKHYFQNAKTFCEIGCGTGNVIAALASVSPEIKFTGSEIYASALSYAVSRIPNAQFIQADACNLPFEEEFDVIGAFDVLEHIENDQCAINNIYKSLKPSGGFIVTVPQHKWLWSASDVAAYHQRRYTRKEIMIKLAKAGFKVKRMTSFVTLLFPLMIASRLKYKIHKNAIIDDFIEDFNISPQLNKILKKCCDFDVLLTQKGLALPFGGTLACVAVKP